jgi:hypothetical protein
LDFTQTQLHYMKVRFFSLSGLTPQQQAYFDEGELFKNAYTLIYDAAKVRVTSMCKIC